MNTSTRNEPGALPLIGRLLLALLFLGSGLSKIFMPAAAHAEIAQAHLPLPTLAYFVAVVVEVGGGVLLLLGYRVKLAAWALSAFTLAAAVFFHANMADPDQMAHFMKNLAIIGGLLTVASFGPGALSLDRRLGRRAGPLANPA